MQDGGYHPASKIPIKRLIKLPVSGHPQPGKMFAARYDSFGESLS